MYWFVSAAIVAYVIGRWLKATITANIAAISIGATTAWICLWAAGIMSPPRAVINMLGAVTGFAILYNVRRRQEARERATRATRIQALRRAAQHKR